MKSDSWPAAGVAALTAVLLFSRFLARIFSALWTPPIVWFSVAMLAGHYYQRVNERASDRSIAVDVSTDAWPFSYMPRRVYSVSYLGLIGLVLLVGVALTANFIRERACYRGNRS